MTDDPGIRDTFQYMIARDTMHQNQWMAALEDMKAEGLDGYPFPVTFTADSLHADARYQFWNLAEGTDSQQGRWASGPTPDGKGNFVYLPHPQPLGPEPASPPPDARLYDMPLAMSVGHADGAPASSVAGTIKQAVAAITEKVTH